MNLETVKSGCPVHLNSKLHPVFNQIPADIQLLQMSWLNGLLS
jgi:hypothetical protein